MNADDLADYIDHPSQLYKISWQELKSLVQQYPYCQNLQYLLARKSHLDERKDRERYLQTAAVYSVNRAFLYQQFQEPRKLQPKDQQVQEEAYLELNELSSPEPPLPVVKSLESSIEFIEPTIEDEPLSLDLSTDKDTAPESASDNYIPLNELAEMDENKHNLSRDGNTDKPEAKKNVMFIEDLIGKKEREKEREKKKTEESLSETPVAKEPLVEAPIEKPQPPQVEEPEEEPIAAVMPPQEAAEPILEEEYVEDEEIEEYEEEDEDYTEEDLEEEEEAAAPSTAQSTEDIPLEITEESRPIAPVPKASFSSWLQQFRSPALSIKYQEEVSNPPKPARLPKPVKAVKKEEVKAPKIPKKPSTKAFAAKSFNDHDDLASETLAKIHEQQGNYEAAIAMYEKLSLIFPEKSALFAVKIENLKKL